jgi:hypothetical protein
MSSYYQVVYCDSYDVHKLGWSLFKAELININPWHNNTFIAVLKITSSGVMVGVNNDHFINEFRSIKQNAPSLTCLTLTIPE